MGLNLRLPLHILALTLVFGQVSCKSTQTQPQELSFSYEQQLELSAERAKKLLERAEAAENEEKIALMLEAAEILSLSGDTPWARSIINNLPPLANPDAPSALELQVKKRLILSRIAAAEGYYPLAYDTLNSDFITDASSELPNTLAQGIFRLRGQLLYDMGFYASSVEERVKLGNVLPPGQTESAENDALIWQTLMQIPLAQLQKLAEQPKERELHGWYELAILSKNNQTNLEEQLAQLDQWLSAWPDHPASLSLPADLQLLRQLVENLPTKIALLLPFSGRLASAGQAIRDGFLAAMYEHSSSSQTVPELRFYDTERSDINTLYDQAVSEGAQLIIGPLSKGKILEITLRPTMPVPTLALNTIDNPKASVGNLYQFGLGVEDEARLAARQAWRDGHRRALIIAPNNAWGDRSVQAFALQWQVLGGELSSDYRFEDTNDYVKVINRALQLDQSNQRAQQIRSIVGKVEFEPRRRDDIDVIFLAAQAQQARQIKPTLAFNFAGSIPVYGTSQVYSGRPNKKLDQDMNGIKFSTLPWTFNDSLAEKKAIRSNTENSAGLQPLYALGVDCFYLYPRLKQLEQVAAAQYYGQTGTLKLNEQRQIIRQQVWAEFKNGRAQPLADAK